MFVPEIHPRLVDLGWTPFFHQQWLTLGLSDRAEPLPLPERVAAEHRTEYVLVGAAGTRRAVLSGRLRHEAAPETLPTVGDWVLASVSDGLARIEHVFERKTLFARKASGRTSAVQPIAANIDVAFVVTAVASDDADPYAVRHGLNLRRIERYVRAIAASGAEAVIVLNNVDLCRDPATLLQNVREAFPGVDVIATSTVSSDGAGDLRARLAVGQTAVLAGSSGVGKSSLVNRLLGDALQEVSAVRDEDAKGRHSTSRRELFALSSGGVIIDTPGMRELGLAGEDAPEATALGDDALESLAAGCRFSDCTHEREPGCAVRAAIERGELDRVRVEHARQLARELERQRERHDRASQRDKKRSMRRQARDLRSRLQAKGRTED